MKTNVNKETLLKQCNTYIRNTSFGQHVANKAFFHYTWTGGFFTILNIFFVWLFIDIFKIPTIISSIIVIGGLFFARYFVYRWLKVM